MRQFTFFLIILSFSACQWAKGQELVKDFDGNSYWTLRISNQIWFAENLYVTHYRNGDPIPKISNNLAWCNQLSGAYCEYHLDRSNSKNFGNLYNWFAISDRRGLCPLGWRVPNNSDWDELEMTLGGAVIAGGKMKEKGFNNWKPPNTGATNESGFNGLPVGYRSFIKGGFAPNGKAGFWWSGSEYNADSGFTRLLSFENSRLGKQLIYDKAGGLSVRCIKERK